MLTISPAKCVRRLGIIFALVLLGSDIYSQANVFNLSGRVTNQASGAPIVGVAVTAVGNLTGTKVALTDSSGNFALSMGANTNIKFRAYRQGFIFSPLSSELTSPVPLTGNLTRDYTGTALPLPLFDLPPFLLTEDETLSAFTLNALTRTRNPFTVTTNFNFGADNRTRLILLLVDLDLSSGEQLSTTISATIANSLGQQFPLAVEDLRKGSGMGWLTQLTARLPPELANSGDVTITVTARGQVSNQAKLRPL